MSQMNTVNKTIQSKTKEEIKKGMPLTFIPILVLLGIVPLITRIKVIDANQEIMATLKQSQVADFFSYYKVTFILLLAVTMLIILFFNLSKEDIQKFRELKVFIGALGGFLFFSLLSTLLSPYKETALWGVPGRMEGMLVIGAYGLMVIYTIYSFKRIKDFKYIVISLSFLVGVLTFLGIFEYAGHNLLSSTKLGLNILFPKEYEQYKSMLELQYEKGKVYGTLYHYNYMGSFGALMVPLFATLTIYIKDIRKKIYCGLFTLASLFLLFGSTSRGGLIGVALAAVVGFILFSKNIIKNWKLTLPVLGALVVIVVGLNFATKGTIFERIPSLLKDIGTSFSKGGEDFDYRDFIPLRDIRTEQGKTTLVTQTDELVMAYEGGVLKFYDQSGQEVEAIDNGQTLTLADPRYVIFSFDKIYDQQDKWAAVSLAINGQNYFIFMMDQTEGVYLINSFTQQKEEVAYPETFGFKGKERLGSARGYIWSRSIPMLKKTVIIGHGPDTYPIDFPQNDYLGKYYAYDTPNMIVDKPHNLYLQIGINEGVIALVWFLVLIGIYIGQSVKLYAFKKEYQLDEIVGIAILLSLLAYLGAGFFNDSVVAVAPLFWVMIGTGIAVNILNRKRAIETKASN